MNWMHSCRKVAELLSQRLDEPLGLVDSLRLRVHLSMCDNCRHVDEQLVAVNSLAADLFASNQAFESAPEFNHDPGNRPREPGPK